MNFKRMSRFFSLVLLAEAIFLIPPIVISIFDGTHSVTLGFAATLGVALLLSVLFGLLSRNAEGALYTKEGFVCVSVSWLLMSLVGCLPFVISGEIPHFVDALFEIVSGFTTTGSSTVADVEALCRATNYWRCFSHWVGGMGVLVFLLAVAPGDKKSEGFTMHLFRAESPGPEVGKLVPKMRQTAIFLYGTYILLTLLDFVFLVFDMDVFEAVCTAFGTAGTGGFSVTNAGMAGYSSYVRIVTTVFMLLFGVNFSCYYLLFLRQIKAVLCDEELRLYIAIVVASIALITCNVLVSTDLFSGVGETVEHVAFTVSSIITTTGYASFDHNLLPPLSQGILMILMFTGACAGSTCGGAKLARILLFLKGLRRDIHKMIHPRQIQAVRVNGTVVDERVMANTSAYMVAYLSIFAVSLLLISLDGQTTMTNVSAVLACFGNIGPGFGAVGSTGNFTCFGPLSKIVLSFDMLAGRLEIFPLLLTFSRSVWKRS